MPPIRKPLVLARLALAVAGRPVARWAPPAPLPEDVPSRTALTADLALWRLPVGFVRVRRRHRELEPELWEAPNGFRFPLMMADTRLTDWLPCAAWLIEHPEGAILVDTGASPRFGEADWGGVGRVGRRLYPRIVECRVPPGAGLVARLGAAGMGARDVRTCVLTHLHSDHVDNVADLGAGTRLVLSERETRDTRGSGRLPGRLPRDGRVVFTDALPSAPTTALEEARALTAPAATCGSSRCPGTRRVTRACWSTVAPTRC